MNFGKTMLATMLGSFITMIILILIAFAILIGLIAAASSEEEVVISHNTILNLNLNKPIADRSPNMPWFLDPGNSGEVLGLNDIVKNIRKAKEDPKIAGIYLNTENIEAGLPALQQICQALNDFKTSGKFILSYGNYYSQGAYYLATEATQIGLNPKGGLVFKGLNAELMFLKGLFDKIDVDVQIIRYGKFKAATEPLFLKQMSEENREQITRLITVLWDQVLTDISARRHIPAEKLNELASNLSIKTASDAKTYQLIDTLMYKDQVLAQLKTLSGIDSTEKLRFVSLEDYEHVRPVDKERAKEHIGVVFASGSIIDGEGSYNNIGGEKFSRTIRKARENKRIKAVVLRVNSGGGSALASEVIWREVMLTAKEKPVIASFGDVAASGGYYIACPATKIMAEPTTVTGSIGVWAAIPNLKGLMNNKLGITFDNAKTNENADFISVMQPLTPYQRNVLQEDIDSIYVTFANRVADGRDMTFEEVDAIGQGRIWAGADALENGLIDTLGGLTDAIKYAAKLAQLDQYEVIDLPRQKDPFQQLMDELMGKKTPEVYLREALGPDYKYLEAIRKIRDIEGIQAALPFALTVR